MAKFTPKQGRAIQAFIEKGYRLQMNNGPGGLNFENKETGEIEKHTVKELLGWYEEDLAEVRRQKAADKKRAEAQKRRYA
jgi:hypothetical protein